jgi:uncharacterized protein (DUF1330 family)
VDGARRPVLPYDRAGETTPWPSTISTTQQKQREKSIMAKAYWVSAYRAVKDADKLAAYAKLAGPAITGGGGRFLARGLPSKTYEHGLTERTVLIEFDSVEQAKATHDSPAYQAALAALGDGAERDIRIIEAA